MKALTLATLLLGSFHLYGKWSFSRSLGNMFFNMEQGSELYAPPLRPPSLFCRKDPRPVLPENVKDLFKPIPSTLSAIVELSDSFNRTTRSGRRACKRAMANWYEENSAWAQLGGRRQRLERSLELLEEGMAELRSRGIRLHRDISLDLLACIGVTEVDTYYPETVTTMTICNSRCNNLMGAPRVRYSRDPKVCRMPPPGTKKGLGVGLGQMMPHTFREYTGELNFYDFESLPDRPDIQLQMKILLMNKNLSRNFSRHESFIERFISNTPGDGKCLKATDPNWIKAVAYYDQYNCSSYVNKIRRCLDRCFPEGSRRRGQMRCLLDFE